MGRRSGRGRGGTMGAAGRLGGATPVPEARSAARSSAEALRRRLGSAGLVLALLFLLTPAGAGAQDDPRGSTSADPRPTASDSPRGSVWYANEDSLNLLDGASTKVLKSVTLKTKSTALASDPEDGSVLALGVAPVRRTRCG